MQTRPQKSLGGFTLVEVMVAVAIATILLMVAYPSYQSQLVDGRRTDAQGALLAFATAMERFRSDNNTYVGADVLGSSKAPLTTVYPSQAPVDSNTKYYDLTIEAVAAGSYTLRATPITGTAQDGDGYLEITSTGIKRWDQDDDGSIGSGEASWNQ
ncbi:MAG: prepilin-type N-terminal cleavage/methylation domain-containing protein [Motiliproteus sp.]|nr:prepilin-type N-terminal cleavage/methylation domain-containing protein [Motiliproteus sp.]MCW9051527.1 prepilin-type N-terminal cleavage/methylation domain-containing protein [Motiliproteus sp.]